jgi:hypothetical protein
MTRHIFIYIGILALAFVVILFGSYYLLPHWFPRALGSESQPDRDTQQAILKLLSGAAASFVTAVLAGAISVFNLQYQIRAQRDFEKHKRDILQEIDNVSASAAQRLEVQRGDILDNIETKKAKSAEELEGIRKDSARELEGIKSTYTAELESHKSSLAGQLATQKQQFADELSLERLRIEQSHRNLDTVLTAVSEYRASRIPSFFLTQI